MGLIAAEHMGPLLYALELCALSMDQAGRSEDAVYYRSLARQLAEAGGTPPDADGGSDPTP
ncbi:MAG: hypothetical protein AMS18_15510 [Gemmatimonas sp. SG8_17]|nr:MAG: hypothetical protein AMS18_15510 [Gemmatimonas sp. SG8_17]